MEHHEHHHHHHHIDNANKTLTVIIVTIITMVLEIVYGSLTNSMALLADGWHMGTHAFALGIALAAYIFISKIKNKHNSEIVGEKISALAGYTSSVFLLLTAIWLVIESIMRFISPLKISFDEAIFVAFIGLFVNLLCIFIMEFKHNKKDNDYNFKAAYLHILADVITSVLAIIALFTGKYFNLYFLDAFMGIVGAIMIFRWSIGLIKNTSHIILDIDKLKE